MMRARLIVGTVCLLALAVVPVRAQVVVNPTAIEFTASVDHHTVIEGVTVLTSYRVDFYLPGATAPFQTGTDLGKPAPGANNVITVVRPAMFALPLGSYLVRVAAVGPGGEASSLPAGPFVRIPPPAAPTNVAARQ